MKTLSAATRKANPDKKFIVRDKKSGMPFSYHATKSDACSALSLMKSPSSFKVVRMRIA